MQNPVESGHFSRGKFGNKKIKDGQQKNRQGQSARCAAKAAASEYIARFSASGLILGQALALPDTELSAILSLKKPQTSVIIEEYKQVFVYDVV